MSEELNKFVIVQAVSSKSVHGCFVENVEVYGVFDSFSEAYEYAHKNKLGVSLIPTDTFTQDFIKARLSALVLGCTGSTRHTLTAKS
jgi:hypothetical protein